MYAEKCCTVSDLGAEVFTFLKQQTHQRDRIIVLSKNCPFSNFKHLFSMPLGSGPRSPTASGAS